MGNIIESADVEIHSAATKDISRTETRSIALIQPTQLVAYPGTPCKCTEADGVHKCKNALCIMDSWIPVAFSLKTNSNMFPPLPTPSRLLFRLGNSMYIPD
jgi:hypothetical protein